MNDVQLENALKLAWEAYAASREEEAVHFFNIALTVDPECSVAKIGKGCAILRPFALPEAIENARQVLALWQQASGDADFADAGRDLIARAALEFLAVWNDAVRELAEAAEAAQETEEAGEKENIENENGLEQNQKEMASWLGAITDLNGMSENVGYLKDAMGFLDDVDPVATELSELRSELRKKLFFARHPYKATIIKAQAILPDRTDYDGKPQCGFAMFNLEKYECKGKIDVQKNGMKINDIRLLFTAEEDSVRLSIQNENSIRVEDPARIENQLKGICRIWEISSDNKSIMMKFKKEYVDGEVSGALDGIHGEMDGLLREGEKILDVVQENGGKQGLFASLFGKKK